MKPRRRTTAYRSVAYAEDGVLIGTGQEAVEEVDLCQICDEIAADEVPYECGHKVVNQLFNKWSGLPIGVQIEEYKNEGSLTEEWGRVE
jgi:hypothetical protein